MDAQQIAFFSVAATVIPVLFLALVYQRGFFEPAEEAISPLLDLWTLALFPVGEGDALGALALGDHGPGAYALTVIPLALGGLGLVGPIAGPRLIRAWHEAGKRENARSFEMILDRVVVAFFGAAIFALPTGIAAYLALRAMFNV